MTIDKIISTVASYYGVPVRWIVTPKGTRGASGHSRRIAMFLAKVHTDANWTQIGESFGKHRTSVLEACRVIAADRDERVIGEIAAIERILFT